MSTLRYRPLNLARWLAWGGYAALLVAAPIVFSKPAALTLLCQMGTMMILGLSYNMLLGQGGMLSFGHAVYSGLGAYLAIHALNLAAQGALPVPVSLLPLVGGMAGLLVGVLLGYVTTRRAGTTFAMITLGLVELVFAMSLMFPGFFGGEGGITANRVIGKPVLGISFGPQIQVYYLIAAWLMACTVAMYAFTQTPLGRIINAVRDNPERVAFLGYDPVRVRYLVLVVSAFFAGISGGLAAINFEIVSAENVSALRSGAILLFTFIGGAGLFFGPLLGAVVGLLATVLLPEFTPAWQLYLGIFFVLLVRFAPAGLASILVLLLRVALFGRWRRIQRPLAAVSGAAVLLCAGAILAIEMLYRRQLDAAHGPVHAFCGIAVDTSSSLPWMAASAMVLAGAAAFWRTQTEFAAAWDAVHGEIAALQRKGG